MEMLRIILQLIIALGIINVWVLRYGKATDWRAGNARNMVEEFKVYGLPPWFMRLIGIVKVSVALVLIAGIWVPALARPAAAIMAILMMGAVTMHFKVKDPLQKSLPASTLVILSLIVAAL